MPILTKKSTSQVRKKFASFTTQMRSWKSYRSAQTSSPKKVNTTSLSGLWMAFKWLIWMTWMLTARFASYLTCRWSIALCCCSQGQRSYARWTRWSLKTQQLAQPWLGSKATSLPLLHGKTTTNSLWNVPNEAWSREKRSGSIMSTRIGPSQTAKFLRRLT